MTILAKVFSLLHPFTVIWVPLFSANVLSNVEVHKLVPLNFQDLVYESSDAWVVYIDKGNSIPDELQITADYLMGSVKLGVIKYKDFVRFLQDENAHSGHFIIDNFRTFPYGLAIHKMRKWKNAETMTDAVEEALKSIPDTTESLPGQDANHQDIIKSLFHRSYGKIPPTLPVLYLTNEKEIPIFYRALATKFSELFYFASIKDPSFATLASYQLYEAPHLIVLMIKETEDQKLGVATILYRPSMHGEMAFKNVARFLYLVHTEYFRRLPAVRESKLEVDLAPYFQPYFKDAMDLFTLPSMKHTSPETSASQGGQDSEAKETKETIADKKKKERKLVCQDKKTNICLFFLSTKYNSNFSTPDIQEFNQYLTETAGKVVEAYQLMMPCNEKFEFQFDLDEEETPAVLVALPQRRLFTISSKVSTSVQVLDFLKITLTGNSLHQVYEKLPLLHTSDCLREIEIKQGSQSSSSGEKKDLRFESL